MNQSELETNARNRRQERETRATKMQLILVLHLIGRERGARFFNQSQSKVKQNQSKRNLLSTLS